MSRRHTGGDEEKYELLDNRKDDQPTPRTTSIPIFGRISRDEGNILLLLFLYVLQGIPLGLAGSIPMILQNKNISYKEQATFSLAFWPFSVKLLWAPIVDSCYWIKMGRRKSWLIPSQYLIGLFMLVLSTCINNLLGSEGNNPQVWLLTCVFFSLSFLAATQDIAVDGWALTILPREKVGWASTCNSVGQTAGFFLGYVLFLALESKDFCVNYLGQDDSIVTLAGFLYFWGIVFIMTTSLVWLFKTETNEFENESSNEVELGLFETYSVLWKILRMDNIKTIVLVLLTCKIGFAAADSLTVLKLTEAGVPKDRLALLSIPLTPVQVLLPFYISRYTAGPKPMNTFLAAIPYRLCFGLVFAALVWVTPSFMDSDGLFPTHYYVMIVFIYLLHQITTNCMFVSVMAFFARVSDPSVGGTYMTLLNTFTNLGGNWPTWVALRFVSEITWTSCKGIIGDLTCNSSDNKQYCTENGGSCITMIDGYYVESIVLVTIGFLWYMWGAPTIRKLQNLPTSSWLVTSSRTAE